MNVENCPHYQGPIAIHTQTKARQNELGQNIYAASHNYKRMYKQCLFYVYYYLESLNCESMAFNPYDLQQLT